MPSEQRLHPASLLFAVARTLKAFALPGLLFLLGFGQMSSPGCNPTFGAWQPPENWQLWLMVLIIPSIGIAIVRYVTFRMRYDEGELVIRSGVFFKNERHIPYHRIQNLEAVQNIVHRVLRLVEVRIETGAGKEPEATISVIPEQALVEMRRRVFAGSAPGTTVDAAASPDVTAPGVSPALATPTHERREGHEQTDVEAALQGRSRWTDTRTLLRLDLRELLLLGFLDNRGMVVIGAAFGVMWELGILGPLWDRVFGENAYAPGMVRSIYRAIATGSGLPIAQITIVMTGLALLLAVVRVLSMVLSALRLHDFHVTRTGEDLRVTFGLTTRVTSTIPLRRVQSLTVTDGVLYRLFSRTSVRVTTAGGQTDEQPRSRERQLLAPIIRTEALGPFLADVLPTADLDALEWHPAHPSAFRRAVKPTVFFAALPILVLTVVAHWLFALALPFAVAWGVIAARTYVQRLGWASTGELVAFRSGFLRRHVTVVPISRVQVVALHEGFFDRRWSMARVRVDTAGAGELSHRVDIPYLPKEVASGLHGRLAAAAGASDFRW